MRGGYSMRGFSRNRRRRLKFEEVEPRQMLSAAALLALQATDSPEADAPAINPPPADVEDVQEAATHAVSLASKPSDPSLAMETAATDTPAPPAPAPEFPRARASLGWDLDADGDVDTVDLTIFTQQSDPVGSQATAVGSPPSIPTALGDREIDEDGWLGSIPFQVIDADTPASALKVTVTSSNSAIFPKNNILVEGTGQYRSMTLTPARDAHGHADITVAVTDGQTTVKKSFRVTVHPVNDRPTTVGLPNLVVEPKAGKVVIDLFSAFHDIEDPVEKLSFKVTSNTNPDLFTSVVIDPEVGKLVLRWNPDARGSADLTVTATDTGGLSVELNPLATTIPVFDRIAVDGLVTDDIGLKKMRLWTSWHFFSYDEATQQYQFDELREDHLRRVLHDARYAITDGPVVLDIENDLYENNPEGRDRWAEVLDIVHQERPELNLGIYRMLPERNWFDPYNWRVTEQHHELGIQSWYTLKEDEIYKGYVEWKNRNQLYRTMPVSADHGGGTVAERIDHVNASLYTLKRNYEPEGLTHLLRASINPSLNTVSVSGPSFADVERVWLVAATDARLPSGITSDQPYYIVNKKGNTFQLATRPGGPALDLDNNFFGRIYVGAVGPWANPWLDPNVVNWKRYAEENISEARKYGVPVYAWVTPSVHARGDEYLEKDFFRLQLDILAPLVDGIVIYEAGPHSADFHREQGWFQALKDFMNENRVPLPTFTITIGDGQPTSPSSPNTVPDTTAPAIASPTYDVQQAAYYYDGKDDYLDVGNLDSLKIRDRDYSISLWFRIEPGSEGRVMYLVSQGYSASKDGFDFRYRGDYMSEHGKDPRLEFVARDLESGGYTYLSAHVPDLKPGQWAHAVVTVKQGGEARLYLNGKLRKAVLHEATGDIDGAYSFHVGRSNYFAPYDQYFHGHIDEVRVFHKALASDEVAALYGDQNAGLPSSVAPIREVARFDTDAVDVSFRVEEQIPPATLLGLPGVGPPSPADGRRGTSIQLDGTNYALLDDRAELEVRNRPFTVSAWFYIQPGHEADIMHLVSKGFAAGNDGFDLVYRGDYKYVYGKDQRLEFIVHDAEKGSQTYLTVPVPDLVAGKWHHVVVTIDPGGEARLYMNGELRRSAPYWATGDVQSELPLRIGRSNYAQPYERPWYGMIDRVQIFGGTLTLDHIKALYRTALERANSSSGSLSISSVDPLPTTHEQTADGAFVNVPVRRSGSSLKVV